MKVAILGAGGFTGRQLLFFLSNHPNFEVVHISSDKYAGKSLTSIFPNLSEKFSNLIFKNHNSEIPSDSMVVLAVPDEVSLELTPKLLNSGHKVIDISGVFRIHSKDEFEKYYNLKHTSFDLMQKAVYGLTEMNRDKIKNSNFVSNPGCYATSIILPIYLLGKLRDRISSHIVISSASGVSGAGGRKEEVTYSYMNIYDNYKAYRVLDHQHTPEIEEYINFGSNTKLPKIIFTPHLLPLHSGILTDIVVQFNQKISLNELQTELKNFENEKFIRIYSNPEDIQLHKIQKTNFIDISYKLQDNYLVIISALDNLIKGAAGQALQNMNLMCGFNETLGLI